jgi:hypothetical protein
MAILINSGQAHDGGARRRDLPSDVSGEEALHMSTNVMLLIPSSFPALVGR